MTSFVNISDLTGVRNFVGSKLEYVNNISGLIYDKDGNLIGDVNSSLYDRSFGRNLKGKRMELDLPSLPASYKGMFPSYTPPSKIPVVQELFKVPDSSPTQSSDIKEVMEDPFEELIGVEEIEKEIDVQEELRVERVKDVESQIKEAKATKRFRNLLFEEIRSRGQKKPSKELTKILKKEIDPTKFPGFIKEVNRLFRVKKRDKVIKNIIEKLLKNVEVKDLPEIKEEKKAKRNA